VAINIKGIKYHQMLSCH